MGLSSDILKEFASIVNNKSEKNEQKKITSVYGTVVVSGDGRKYVQLDGSEYLTPLSQILSEDTLEEDVEVIDDLETGDEETGDGEAEGDSESKESNDKTRTIVDIEDGDRVLVEIKDHIAIVVGNFTAPPSLRETQKAVEKSENAEQAANEAMQNLQDAKDAATRAEEAANEASQKAEEAVNKAEESQKASEEAMSKIEEANEGIAELNQAITDVRDSTNNLRDEIKQELEDVISIEMAETYAKKDDLVELEGELRGEIRANAGELETEFSEHYVTKSELVKIEEYLNTKINQNSEEIILSASRTTQLETDTDDIREDLIAAQNKVREAVRLANESKDAANAAQRDLDRANEELANAQTELSEALEYYDQLTNKDDATEEEIANAYDAVLRAEQAVNKATTDVEAAHAAADAALADAQEAEEALAKAKEELAKVSSKVTELEAKIDLNAEAIKLSATKKELTDFSESLDDRYYTKEESEALFRVDADAITSTVKNSIQEELKKDISTEVTEQLGDMEIGSRNMCLGTSSDYREVSLGSEYITLMRFKMEELCEEHGLVDGDILTYSVFLKTDSGKTIAAGWQKYNSNTDRSGSVSDKAMKNCSGRSYVHPVIDTKYEYLDLMISNVSTSITTTTTEYYRCLQLEKGSVVTDWHPAPEDTGNLEVGGRNLLKDTKNFGSLNEQTYSTLLEETYNDFKIRYYKNSSTGNRTLAGWYDIRPSRLGQEYTFSFWAKGSGRLNAAFTGPTGQISTIKSINSQGETRTDTNSYFTVTSEWIRYWATYTLADEGNLDSEKYVRILTAPSGEIYVCGPKLELGNVATDWSPAPEDFDNALDAVVKRVVESESKIEQNAQAIALSVTETTLEERLGGYYTKEESEALFTVDADGITSIVKNEITKIDFGGRNLLLDSELIEHVRTNVSQSSLYPKPILVNSDYGLEVLKDGGEFTLSFDYEITGMTSATTLYWSLKSANSTYSGITANTEWIELSVGDNVGHFSTTFVPTDGMRQYGTDWMIEGSPMTNKNANAVFKFKHIKFEKGNKATDWTPAPEDVDEGISGAYETANGVNGRVDETNSRLESAESIIQQLADSISMLVTDESGSSLMTQTANGGWTFCMGDTAEAVNGLSQQLNDLYNQTGSTQATVDSLNQSLNDIADTMEYIRIGVYQDEPCIELGESDSDYALMITNTRIMFRVGSSVPTLINTSGLVTENIQVENELRVGRYIWSERGNGNFGLRFQKSIVTIVRQPENVTIYDGERAIITVEAAGSKLTYSWQMYYSSKWNDLNAYAPGYSTIVNLQSNVTATSKYRCVITDKYGNSVTTNEVTVTTLPKESTNIVTITRQPQNLTLNAGETGSFTVEASGDGLTYQWYYKNSGSSTFSKATNNGYNTKTYTMSSVTASNSGRQVYCIVTDKYGNTAQTNTVTLTVETQQNIVTITKQPQNLTLNVDTTGKFTVEATGDGLTYQWYYKNPGSSTFSKATSNGYNTASYTQAPTTTSSNGKQAYCIITDQYGNSVQTNTVTLTVVDPEAGNSGIKITKDLPDTITYSNYGSLTMTVEAEGNGLQFTWKYSDDGGSTWTNYSTNSYTSTITSTATSSIYKTNYLAASISGRLAKCVITDSSGNTLDSNICTLTAV